jgi:hypothetical protein
MQALPRETALPKSFLLSIHPYLLQAPQTHLAVCLHLLLSAPHLQSFIDDCISALHTLFCKPSPAAPIGNSVHGPLCDSKSKMSDLKLTSGALARLKRLPPREDKCFTRLLPSRLLPLDHGSVKLLYLDSRLPERGDWGEVPSTPKTLAPLLMAWPPLRRPANNTSRVTNDMPPVLPAIHQYSCSYSTIPGRHR